MKIFFGIARWLFFTVFFSTLPILLYADRRYTTDLPFSWESLLGKAELI